MMTEDNNAWHRADNGSTLLYTLRHDGWRKGQPVMVNDVTIRIERANGSETDIESVVSRVLSGLSDTSVGWQDISTAPKDGSNILAWCDDWHGFHIVHWDDTENAWVEGSWVFSTGPTDWSPLEPPSRSSPPKPSL